MEKFFIVSPDKVYLTITIRNDMDQAYYDSYEGCVEELVNSNLHIFINCEAAANIPIKWFRYMIDLQVKLKKNEKKMVWIINNQVVQRKLRTEGLDKAFICVRTIKDAFQEINYTPKKRLNTDFANPFLAGTMHVLKVQANIESHAGQIFLKKSDDKFYGDVSGVIGIISDHFNGTVVISFPENTFLKVISSMLGEEYKSLDKELLDGAGEITNMIFGYAKQILNEKGYGIKMALPSVVSGKDHSLSSSNQGTSLVIPFESAAGNFFVEICLSP